MRSNFAHLEGSWNLWLRGSKADIAYNQYPTLFPVSASGRIALRVANLFGLGVPVHLLVALEGERRHMAGNGGLLPRGGGRDHLLIAAHRFDEVADVIDHAILLAQILWTVDVQFFPRFHGFRGGALQQLRIVMH